MTARSNAFTLVELMMAAVITTLIGLTVASVAGALSYSYTHTQDANESLQGQRNALMNTEKSLRTAKLVVSATSTGLIVWKGDLNSNKAIDLNELVKIEYDSANRQVVQTSLEKLTGALNSKLSLASTNVYSTTKSQMDSSVLANYSTIQVLATDVGAFTVVTNQAPPKTVLVGLRLTIGQDDQAITVTDSVMLRADDLDLVTYVNNVPVLTLP